MTSFTRRVGSFCEGHLQHRVVQRLVDTTTGLELSFQCQHHLPIGSNRKPFFAAKFAGTCYVRQLDLVLREMPSERVNIFTWGGKQIKLSGSA